MERKCSFPSCQEKLKINYPGIYCEPHRQPTNAGPDNLEKAKNLDKKSLFIPKVQTIFAGSREQKDSISQRVGEPLNIRDNTISFVNPSKSLNESPEKNQILSIAAKSPCETSPDIQEIQTIYQKLLELSRLYFIENFGIQTEIDKIEEFLNQMACEENLSNKKMNICKKAMMKLLKVVENNKSHFLSTKQDLNDIIETFSSENSDASRQIFFCKYEKDFNLKVYCKNIEDDSDEYLCLGPKFTRKVLSCRIDANNIFFCSCAKNTKSFLLSLSNKNPVTSHYNPSIANHMNGAFILFGSRIYFFGGKTTICEYFDISERKWVQIRDIPENFKKCSCCIFEGKIHIVCNESKKVMVYNEAENEFEELSIRKLKNDSVKISLVVDGNFLVVEKEKVKKFIKEKKKFKKIGMIERKKDEKVISTGPLIVDNCAYFVDFNGGLISMNFKLILESQ